MMSELIYSKKIKQTMLALRIVALSALLLLSACEAFEPAPPSSTPVELIKVLATAHVSATPNPEQDAATRAASSPTPLPPSPTVIPTETPYIGIFIGEAEPETSFIYFSQPLFNQNTSAEPTANPDVCQIPIDPYYTPAWRNNLIVSQRIGCPIQQSFGFFGKMQIFEYGIMYYYPELNAVWAIIPERDSTRRTRGKYAYLESPPQALTGGVRVPDGLQAPDGIFGDIWLAVEGLQEEIGFAQTDQEDVALGLQRFENGTFLVDITGEQVFALITDGMALGPYLAPQVIEAEAVTPTPAATLESTPSG